MEHSSGLQEQLWGGSRSAGSSRSGAELAVQCRAYAWGPANAFRHLTGWRNIKAGKVTPSAFLYGGCRNSKHLNLIYANMMYAAHQAHIQSGDRGVLLEVRGIHTPETLREEEDQH